MNGKHKKKLAELNNNYNNGKKKSRSNGILLLIAELTAETNGNVKWILWLACAAAMIAVGILTTLALGGM